MTYACGEEEMDAFEEVNNRFRTSLKEHLAHALRQFEEADIVVGIPFYNEVDTLSHVVKTVEEGLKRFYPDSRSVIIAVGSSAGREALEAIEALPQSNIRRMAFLLEDGQLEGKGWHIRAIMEIALNLGADLVLLEADLESRFNNGEVEGLSPEWIDLLLRPIKSEGVDLVLSRFNFHHLDAQVCSNVAQPLLAALYGYSLGCLIGGQWGISYPLLRLYSQEPPQAWMTAITGYGIDSWLATTAIASEARICAANLGIKIHTVSWAKSELVSRQVIKSLFDQIVNVPKWWRGNGASDAAPMVQPIPVMGAQKMQRPDPVTIHPHVLMSRYSNSFNLFHSLYQRIFPKETYQHLAKMASIDHAEADFPLTLWAKIVYRFLLAYAFKTDMSRDDLFNAFISLHNRFVVSFATEMGILRNKLKALPSLEAEELLSAKAGKREEDLTNEFLRQCPGFLSAWEKKAEERKPPVPQITYREFIPGVPLVVPPELVAPDGKKVYAEEIYKSIFTRQKAEFEQFVHGFLNVPQGARSGEITAAIRDFLHQVEVAIPPTGSLSSLMRTKELVNFVFHNFPHEEGFSLTSDMAFWLLWQHPPSSLVNRMGYSNLSELLQDYDPLDTLALASWIEDRDYMEELRRLIAENIRPEHFTICPIEPLVVSHQDFPSLVEMKESSALDKLTSRVVVSSLHKGMGGEFPKLRYLTSITKNIVEAERFGKVWQRFASIRREFGLRVINSLEGHWGREPLSAHNIFEDGHHRMLTKRLRQMADKIGSEADKDLNPAELSGSLKAMADSYHLALTLPDGKFVTCSAWSWASYSFKGGQDLPSPLSLHVERDWFSREFLIEYFKAAGGKETEVEQRIVELMEQGREWEDLASILLGTEKETAQEIVSKDTAPSMQPEAGLLKRFGGNPILNPIKNHYWESKYVLNPGTIRLGDKIYLVYRAFGDDEISRLGLALSEDGFRFSERLEFPIFGPKTKSEEKGCEDPRLTLIGDWIYMLYTAYSSTVAQIALASIAVQDFVSFRWNKWRRHGLVFPGFTDKDATMFPEQFDGEFAMLHRVVPHIWITFSPHLRCPWPRKEHKIVAGTTSGMLWDAVKIGAGAQPIKTKYGWLLVTHGVDYTHIYRLGVMLLDLDDPSVLLYRSPNPVLEPVEDCEIGHPDTCWVPNVVFTCGAIAAKDKKTLEDEDEILVYYGAADTSISVATATVGDLIPKQVRDALLVNYRI